ncbi:MULTISPECIES: helix-turn-helix domain-containing protein [unclassified Cupriavidus]|uniref:helix-turn-helix domain-containing protein n=1 Tax=Cupriavidus TaxID=106589 RepID=UPI002271981C|nr:MULTISPECIES: helix-turn-helix transcriptional regulator [unclassified Cupriavidus]MCY0852642.1 helix-turn-helix transcriptional regulator [Cupriavidus sp. D39]MDW3683282.1 helix-turn-helix transcriptional regulator [Cupriavidus sp. CV2]
MNTIATIDDLTIEQGSDNPYADLGYPDADEMLVKAGLAHEIAQIIKSRHLTQQRAAELLGMPQPKLSELLRGKFRGISQAKMIECLNRLGRDVDIVVRKAGRRTLGHTHVVVA